MEEMVVFMTGKISTYLVRRQESESSYDDSVAEELMVICDIVCKGRDTKENVFFIRPDGK